MQDDVNHKLSAPVSPRVVIVAIIVATLFVGLLGFNIGSISGSSGAWLQLGKLSPSPSPAVAAPEARAAYPPNVVSRCLHGASRDPAVDCAAVLASLPAPKTSHDMAIAAVQTVDTSCPPPTTRDASTGNCLLTSDVVLTKALWLSSGTTLDCLDKKTGKRHRMTPSVDGQSSSWGWGRYGTPFQPSVPSVPSTAVLLAGDTSGVTVKNCVIENFDFGIVIANSKIPPAAKTGGRNLITKNTLNNRYRGVEIIASDRNEIVDNHIYSFAGASGGVSINHDSDDNLVKGNKYVGPSGDWTPGPLFPGGSDEAPGWVGEGVRVMGPVFSYNFKVGNKMFVGTLSPFALAERNVVEENDIDIPNRIGNGLVVDTMSDRTVFRRNIVRQAADGFRLVGHTLLPDTWSKNVLVEGNTVYGPVENGILVAASENPVLRDNTIQQASVAGMLLITQDNATVTNNAITDSVVGLLLLDSGGGSKVWRNDFVDNALNIEAYIPAPLELSFDGVGNFWGHTEPPAFSATDTNDPSMITDSHASLVPVSGLLDD